MQLGAHVKDKMSLAERVRARMPKAVVATHTFRGGDTVVVKREALLEAVRFLNEDPAMAFDFLMDLTCVDYLQFGQSLSSEPTLATPSPLPYYMKPKPVAETWERAVSNDEYRFELVYHFFSMKYSHRLRLKVPLAAADLTVDSVTNIWRAADWFEREVWDMFGVVFTGHPNLKRILMYEAFSGHPLRKDYVVERRQPLVGPVN